MNISSLSQVTLFNFSLIGFYIALFWYILKYWAKPWTVNPGVAALDLRKQYQ